MFTSKYVKCICGLGGVHLPFFTNEFYIAHSEAEGHQNEQNDPFETHNHPKRSHLPCCEVLDTVWPCVRHMADQQLQCVFLDGQAGASFVLGTVVRMQTIVVNGQLP